MLLLWIQVAVFALGCRSVYAAIVHARFFYHTRKDIGQSMVRMLLEQVVCSTCTLLFSFNSLLSMVFGVDTKYLNNFDPYTAAALRVCMFGAMIHSTNHLAHSIKAIVEKDVES